MNIINSAFTYDDVDQILKTNKKNAGILNFEKVASVLDRACAILIQIVTLGIVWLIWDTCHAGVGWIDNVLTHFNKIIELPWEKIFAFLLPVVLLILELYVCRKISQHFHFFSWLLSKHVEAKNLPVALSKEKEIRSAYKTLNDLENYMTAIKERGITDYQISTNERKTTLILTYPVAAKEDNEYIDVDGLAKITSIKPGSFQMERKFLMGPVLKQAVASEDMIDFRKVDSFYGLDKVATYYREDEGMENEPEENIPESSNK